MNEEACTPLIKTFYECWSVSVNIAARKCSVIVTFGIAPTLLSWTKAIKMNKQLKT